MNTHEQRYIDEQPKWLKLAEVMDIIMVDEKRPMFNRDRVIEIATFCGAVACITSSSVGFAVASGLLPYHLLPFALLGVAIGAIALFVIIVLCEGGRS